MSAHHIRFGLVLAALVIAWLPSKASANPEDTQFWLAGFIRGNLSDGVYLTIDTSYRWRDPVFGADQQTFRATVEQSLNDDIRLGGGISFFQTGPRLEIRPHQQFRFARNGLDLRSRFEQRFFDGAKRVELRIRQRVQYTHPVAEGVNVRGSVEWFGIIQPREQNRTSGTEQVRSMIWLSFKLNDHVDISPSYMLQISQRAGRLDTISHIPQLTLDYYF